MIDEGELKNLDRLRWQCRRGMLELDVLLEAFLEQHYSELPTRMQRHFIQLLEFPDPIIHAWCVGGKKPDDEEFAELVASIRATSVA
ncbi:MAG: succinate dehydrogenase assembly factor 2 [Candidatus Thiodiazotropha lotti]|nr:succinate dehydrogenase assembly factor 2 [Candidatus Thiodiazotropha lotti]